ncbi:MAG: putative DNA-binding domain-containing protein [Rhodocyclaceae bacterium]|nr:putative DNA-binding domain-containing protein [Rhodocyclaceae bacterium]
MADGLAAIQRRMADGLLDGGADPVELFRGPPAACARRLALYRGNLTANWQRALAGAYPVLEALVGEEFFRAMAREYGRSHDYRDGDLNRFGAALADFLAGFEPLAGHPYMPDVARLEWALHVAHYGADEAAMSLAELAAIAPQSLVEARVHLHPNVALIASQWAIGRIWQAHQPGAGVTLPSDPRGTSRLIVYRPRWRAECRDAGAGEFAALLALASGECLGDALEQASAAQPDFDPGDAVPRWLEEGLWLAATPPTRYGEQR